MTNSVDLLNRVAGSTKYLTKLDCRQAYFQIGLGEQSRKYTSLQTPFGTYRYLKMSMGLLGASSTLQQIMDIMLRNAYRYADKLLDDVLVWTNDFDEHLTRLDDVLTRLRRAGLTLNVSKCHLANFYHMSRGCHHSDNADYNMWFYNWLTKTIKYKTLSSATLPRASPGRVRQSWQSIQHTHTGGGVLSQICAQCCHFKTGSCHNFRLMNFK